MKKKPTRINPAAAVPQAPRVLRAGSKGAARALAAKAAGETPPPAAEDDDEDEDPEDDDEDERDQGAHDAKADAAAAAYRAAADAAEATKGSDSAGALQAGEDAHDAAMDAGSAFKSSCMSLRGAADDAAPPDSQPAPPAPPAPGAAQALSALAGSSVAAQMQLAQWAGAAQALAKKLGATSIAQFTKLGVEATSALAELPRVRKQLDKRDIRDYLAGALHAGMAREKGFVVNADGTLGEPKAEWLKMSPEDVKATVTLMGFPPGAPVARSVLVVGASAELSGEAGLAARAAANGVTVEIQRQAEQNRSNDR